MPAQSSSKNPSATTRPSLLDKAKRALTVGGTISASTVSLGMAVLGLGLARYVAPRHTAAKINKTNVDITERWIGINNQLINHVLPNTHWYLTIDPALDLRMDGRYVLISNHQSWVDTTVTQYFGQKRMPMTRFFTKFELIYLPFIGQAFYLLGFPMMRRHTKEQIAANPSLKTRDLEVARKAVQQLISQPYTLLNYLEGTRFSPQKHAAQQSPYVNLLKPKAGGLALALNILQGHMDALIDMTIVYPDGIPGYGEFWMGEVPRIAVDLREVKIPDWVNTASYDDDADYRARFQAWVDELWADKDARISAIRTEMAQLDGPDTPDAT